MKHRIPTTDTVRRWIEECEADREEGRYYRSVADCVRQSLVRFLTAKKFDPAPTPERERDEAYWSDGWQDYEAWIDDDALVIEPEQSEGVVCHDPTALADLRAMIDAILAPDPAPQTGAEGEEDDVHPYDVLYAAVWRVRNKLHTGSCATCFREEKRLSDLLDEHFPHWHDWAHHDGERTRYLRRLHPTIEETDD